jgi:hypothetical protein
MFERTSGRTKTWLALAALSAFLPGCTHYNPATGQTEVDYGATAGVAGAAMGAAALGVALSNNDNDRYYGGGPGYYGGGRGYYRGGNTYSRGGNTYNVNRVNKHNSYNKVNKVNKSNRYNKVNRANTANRANRVNTANRAPRNVNRAGRKR